MIGDGLPFHQLHHQEALAVNLLEAMNPGDVAVGQRRQQPGLALEASQPVRILSKNLGQDLEGHITSELGVLRAPHLAHSALTQLGGHLIMQNTASDHAHSSTTPPLEAAWRFHLREFEPTRNLNP